MTEDEALDLALETLESIQAAYPCETVGKRITAIKQARSAPVQDVSLIDEGKTVAPVQWVGLTDEDWKELHLTTNARTYGPAIEAKLKEKNT
jgi:hypothetical protein